MARTGMSKMIQLVDSRWLFNEHGNCISSEEDKQELLTALRECGFCLECTRSEMTEIVKGVLQSRTDFYQAPDKGAEAIVDAILSYHQERERPVISQEPATHGEVFTPEHLDNIDKLESIENEFMRVVADSMWIGAPSEAYRHDHHLSWMTKEERMRYRNHSKHKLTCAANRKKRKSKSKSTNNMRRKK